MAKAKSIYICSACGGHELKWQGQCPSCQTWNSLLESVATSSTPHYDSPTMSSLQKLADIPPATIARASTGNAEFNRVLGGGLVSGSVVLIGGDPGIGKSTLLLQTLCQLRGKALYVSGEESPQQVALRAQRLELDPSQLLILAETRLESILEVLKTQKPEVAVIDSIQTLYTELLQSAPGSVAQVRECAAQLTHLAKNFSITLILVGHVTKEGTLAGPRVLEHMVDTVLYFEGDNHSSFRLIRAFKNRFGAVNELGVFAMTDKGLRVVSNPSALFLSHHSRQVSGSVITATIEGTRPVLIEIQALVNTAYSTPPRRLSIGLEPQRLAMLLAVLHRQAGVPSFDQDVFINAVGGMRIQEPASDLAVLLAIVSSLQDRPISNQLLVFGEVGLAGEVRPVLRGVERIKEAAKLGFKQCIIPKANAPIKNIAGLEVLCVARLEDALQAL